MGTSLSHPPPPLVEVSGPRSKVLIPAGIPFAVNPEPHSLFPFSRGRPHERTPAYLRMCSPYLDYSRLRDRPRHRGKRRPLSDDSMSEMDFANVSPMGRPRLRGGAGADDMGIGGGRVRMGSGPPGGYTSCMDYRAHSTPDLHMGYRPPRAVPRGMSPGIPRFKSPGGPEYGAAPEYGPGMDSSAGVGTGYPYAYPQATSSPPFQGRTQMPLTTQPHPRHSLRPPGLNQVPMGAYAAGVPSPPVRANTEPPTSTRLNRKQAANKRAGPSGQEWIEGDPFLDACTCTTNCTCRKGQRVLYRSQAQDGEGHNGWGEIRYVLKDELGKDCGDHSKCHKHEEGREKGRKKAKDSRDDRSSDKIRHFRDEMRKEMKAVRGQLAEMGLNDGPGSSLGGRYGISNGVPLAMMDNMDPRMMAQFDGNPYATGRPGRLPLGIGRARDRPGRVARTRRPDLLAGELDFDHEVPFSEDESGMGDLMGPMEMRGRPPRMRGGRGPMQPDFIPPRRQRRRGGPRVPPGMGMDMGGFGRHPPRGGRGIGIQRSPPGRRRRPGFSEDEMNMDLGMRRGLRGGLGSHDEFPEMRDDDDDDDDEDWEDGIDGGADPRARHSPPGRPNSREMRPGRYIGGLVGGRGRQARVDDVEDRDE